MSEEMSPENWQEAEKRVNEAEKAERKRKLANVELGQETGLTKADSLEVVAELEKEKQLLVHEAKELLGPENSPENALVGLRSRNLSQALRDERKISLEKEKLTAKETAILKEIEQAQESGKPTRGKTAVIEKTRLRLDELEKDKNKLLESSPEAYFGLHLKELKEYKKNLQVGKLVETPYVKEKAEDIAIHMRAGKPVMIYGHLGTGKTELAMHVAKNYLGKEALIISGSKHTSLAELYGHQVLAIDKIDRNELDQFAQTIEQKFQQWVSENPASDEGEKNRAHDRILQVYLAQLKGGTISDFFLGPIYRAMEEGSPVIIDEVNAIPHEVLISLNHILTRKVGEKINVQQNTGRQVEIKDGFGIIMTGNLNQGQEKYIDRQDMDPAFLSRLYKLEYDYLPQKTEGSLEDEAGSENELFHLLLARIMDKNGNIEVPEGSIKKLWNLAKAARVVQNVFAGREVSSAFYFQQAGGRAARYLLKESVLSIRAVDNILSQWQKEGYRYELDHYLHKEFISQGTVASDRAYLYQQLKDRFGFFSGSGWEQNPNYGTAGNIQSFDVKPARNLSADMDFVGPRELVEFAYGKAPERAQWPEIKTTEEKEEQLFNVEELQALEEFKTGLEKDLVELKKEVKEVCEIEPPNSGGSISPSAKKNPLSPQQT